MSPLTGSVSLSQVNQLVADRLVPFEGNRLNQLGEVGMCRGICLDWIRRFLLARAPSATAQRAAAAAPPSSAPSTPSRVAYSYKLGEGDRGRRRAEIMRNVHGASDAVPVMNDWSAELTRMFAESEDLYRRTVVYHGSRALTNAEHDEWTRLGKQRAELLAKHNAGSEEYDAVIQRMGREGRMHPVWSRMSRQLDEAAARTRADGHVSRRPFSALATLEGEVADRSAVGTRQACGRAVANAHIHSKTHLGAAAAILSASTGNNKVAGHAVAVVAAAPELCFFDPNFGVYTPKEGSAKLIDGMTAILDAYYADCPTIDITWFAAA